MNFVSPNKPNEQNKVAVIVVSFNGEETIIDCVRSINEITKEGNNEITLIIVDNASTDRTLEKVKCQISKLKTTTQMSKLKVIKNKENLGFAGGVNVGTKYALKNGAEYVFLLNQDATVKQGAIEKLVQIIEKDSQIGIVGPLILNPDGTIWSAGGIVDKKRFTAGHLDESAIIRHPEPILGSIDEGILNQVQNDSQVDFVSGCAMMIRNDVFEKIGFFDERFFLYYEDVDFCFRVRKANFKIIFVPQAVVTHHYQSTIEKEKKKRYFMARNHFLFLAKHGPLKIKIREMIRLPKTVLEYLI